MSIRQFNILFILCLFLTLLSGCITYEQVKQPPTGSDQEKIERFDYMESNWSYLNNRWIVAQSILPQDIVQAYGIPQGQAKAEVIEFVELQHDYNWFHRFIISIYLNPIRFYVE